MLSNGKTELLTRLVKVEQNTKWTSLIGTEKVHWLEYVSEYGTKMGSGPTFIAGKKGFREMLACELTVLKDLFFHKQIKLCHKLYALIFLIDFRIVKQA